MALLGTLDTIGLDEVFGLLEHARKTGALHVNAPHFAGLLFFVDGQISAGQSDLASMAVDRTPGEFANHIVDVMCELLLLSEGDFEFRTDEVIETGGVQPVSTQAMLEHVRTILADWPTVETVIPSNMVQPRLVEEPYYETVTVDRAAWRVLFAVDGARTVREIALAVNSGIVATSFALRDLVHVGAVEILGSDGSVIADVHSVGVAASDVQRVGRNAGLPSEVVGGMGDDNSALGAPLDEDPTTDHDALLASLHDLSSYGAAGSKTGGSSVFDQTGEGRAGRLGVADLSRYPEIPAARESAVPGDGPGQGPGELPTDMANFEDASSQTEDRGVLMRMFATLRES